MLNDHEKITQSFSFISGVGLHRWHGITAPHLSIIKKIIL